MDSSDFTFWENCSFIQDNRYTKHLYCVGLLSGARGRSKQTMVVAVMVPARGLLEGLKWTETDVKATWRTWQELTWEVTVEYFLPAIFLVEKGMEGGRPCLVKAPAGAEVLLCSQHTQRMEWLLHRVHCGPELAWKETGKIKWEDSRSISCSH